MSESKKTRVEFLHLTRHKTKLEREEFIKKCVRKQLVAVNNGQEYALEHIMLYYTDAIQANMETEMGNHLPLLDVLSQVQGKAFVAFGYEAEHAHLATCSAQAKVAGAKHRCIIKVPPDFTWRPDYGKLGFHDVA